VGCKTALFTLMWLYR